MYKLYTKYDGIVDKIKMALESNMSIFAISKKLNVDISIIYQICIYYNIRPHIHLQGKPKINMVYNLRILNQDKTLTKCKIRDILGITYTTLNNYLEIYGIEDVNKYKRRLVVELLTEQKLSLDEISEITHYSRGSILHVQSTLDIKKLPEKYNGIKRTVFNTSNKKIDCKTINTCKKMLADITISKKEISKKLGLSKRQINLINNQYCIRPYKARPHTCKLEQNIINLLTSRQHTVKEICEMVERSESVVRSIMKKHNIKPNQQYFTDIVIDRLSNTNMTMTSIAHEVGYDPSVISNINKKYNIR